MQVLFDSYLSTFLYLFPWIKNNTAVEERERETSLFVVDRVIVLALAYLQARFPSIG